MSTTMDRDTAVSILSGLRTVCRDHGVDFRADALDIAIATLREQGGWVDWPECPVCGEDLEEDSSDCPGFYCRKCRSGHLKVETRYRVAK